MNLTDFLKAKYKRKSRYSLRRSYAEAFGIPYPLLRGWVKLHGDMEITTAMLAKAKISQSVHRVALKEKRAIYCGEKLDVASDEFLQSYEWRKLRLQALKLHGAACQCCGASPATGAVMNVDHIKPRKKYPLLALDINNLQILCHDCNHGKGNWDETDWRPSADACFDPIDGLSDFLKTL